MKERLQYINNKIQENSELLLILLLLVFYFTEALTKFLEVAGFQKVEVQAGFKALVFGFVLIALALFKKRGLFYILILTVVFCIGQISVFDGFSKSATIYFFKYVFSIGLLFYFSANSSKPKFKLFKVFEYLLVFTSVLVILGGVFEIPFFKSYGGSRYGYNGLAASTATSTYFYLIGFCYFLWRYKKDLLKNWKFWFIALSSLIIGTKSIVLALAALGLIYILQFLDNRKYKWSLLTVATLMILAAGYYILFINATFVAITKTQGVLTSFLSLRDQLLLEQTLPYIQENWGILNYLFGGVSNFEIRPQMELFDMVLFWGFCGTALYLYFFYKSFVQFPIQGVLQKFLLLLILFIVFLAGNFFYNASVVIYLIILRESFVLNSVISSQGVNKYSS